MTRRELSIHDFDELMAEHAARTAILRAMHPLRRPALDTTERDSEIRVAMGAASFVVIVMAALVLLTIGALAALAFGQLAIVLPLVATAIQRWVATLTVEQITQIAFGLVVLGACALAAIGVALARLGPPADTAI